MEQKLVREYYDDRASWLTGRKNGIGASEISAILGINPWLSVTELWEYKCGYKEPTQKNTTAIEKGVQMEPALRAFYSAINADRKVEHYPYDILYQREIPYIRATLDGEITTDDGRRGVLEIKTSTLLKRTDWEKWQNAVPPYYTAQVCAQLIATGWDFVDLFACLFNQDGDMTIRTYTFNRTDDNIAESMEYVKKKAGEFWERVEKRQFPDTILSL